MVDVWAIRAGGYKWEYILIVTFSNILYTYFTLAVDLGVFSTYAALCIVKR